MDNYFLVYNRPEYESGIKVGFFDFTMEDIDKAETYENGFVGTRNGVDFYLSVKVPANFK